MFLFNNIIIIYSFSILTIFLCALFQMYESFDKKNLPNYSCKKLLYKNACLKYDAFQDEMADLFFSKRKCFEIKV